MGKQRVLLTKLGKYESIARYVDFVSSFTSTRLQGTLFGWLDGCPENMENRSNLYLYVTIQFIERYWVAERGDSFEKEERISFVES